MKMTPEHYEALKGRIDSLVGIPEHLARLRANPAITDPVKNLIRDAYNGARMHQLFPRAQWAYTEKNVETATRRALRELGHIGG